MRASWNMDVTARLDWAQILAARANSIEAGTGAISRCTSAAWLSSSSTCASDSASETAVSPGSTSKPLALSIQTSLMLLSRMRSMSFGSVMTKAERQKGCSIQEPQNSFRCMPTLSWLTLIFLSMV